MELARGVLIAGKYRLDRTLATGGMGSVWVARHAQLETACAIKFMDPQSAASPIARARFEREAKASATLRNKHVVHVLDYGVEADTPYIVMELLYGEDLSRRLHRERRLSLEAASRILTQTARGLRTAHEARVVHRDLKPANIFLSRSEDEDEEVVKLLDFGIAKDTAGAVIGEATKTGELMGSPHYMSPEQVRGARDLDHRSDLWSLSVIMFRALTGRLPFSGDVIGAVIAQILADPIPQATRVAPDLAPALDAFFARGFARDREQRFQTAREMAEALAAIASATAPVSSNPRWTVDEPPTRPMRPSMPAIDLAADAPPAPIAPRPELPSIPTDSMTPGSLLMAGSGPLVGTGGPVIHTAPPPPARPSPLRWLPLAGAGLGIVIGAVAFIAVRPTVRVPGAAAGTIEPAPAASVLASAAPVAETAAPSATPDPPASAPASAEPTAAPPASASAGVAPRKGKDAPPKPAAPSPAAPGKKKPNWGF